jgi:chaperonin GroES
MAKRNQKANSIELTSGSLLYDKVLVKPIVFEESDGILTPQQYEDKPEFGEVVMVGEGRLLDNGTVIPPRIKVGDIVYFEKYSSKKVRVNGEDHLIIREDDIDWTNRKTK